MDFHSVNAKFQDTHFLLGVILLYCLYEEKDNCSVRTLYFVLGNEKKKKNTFKEHMVKSNISDHSAGTLGFG